MAPLFGPSASDLEHLRSTVRALGTASVPGLSAALSWREHKTEKLLAHELARPDSPLVYDPARRTVRWAVAPPEIPAPPPPTPATIPNPSPSAPRAPAPVYTPIGLRTLCPHCQVALQSTGSNGLVVCPECGRLSSARSGAIAAPASPPSSVAPNVPAPGPTATVSVADRKSQELFAAWVTNQPIPCPKCRTPLRHRGIRVYGCPSCGQQVRFPEPATMAAPPPPPEPLPAR
ncbi:MAG: zf-TFIIB domain-containing protein [Thermoplasmata archaeon]